MLGIGIGLAAAIAALVAAAAVAIGVITSHNRFAPPSAGTGTVVGSLGVVREADGTTGQVLVEGARWRATCDVPLTVGMAVRVTGQDGLTLLVEPEGR